MAHRSPGATPAVLVLGLVLAAPALGGSGEPDPSTAALAIVNQSQYRLLELRLHAQADYRLSPNLLETPLDVGGALELESQGVRWLTVYREKYERGPVLAFTTRDPLTLEPGGRYRVQVFDQEFRVEGGGAEPADAEGCSCRTARRG